MALQVGYYTLVVLGIIKKRSKALTVLMLLMMWIVFGLTTYNGDFGNYSWIYQNIQNPAYWAEFEPLYNVLMYACSALGLSFIQFRMVFGAIYLALLDLAITKYTTNKAEVLGLYMLFPFLVFTSVIRSGFAGVLIVLAYHEIIVKGSKWKFWLYMIAACLMQYTSVFFIFYYYLRKKEFRRNSVILVTAIVIAAFVTYYTGLMYRLLSLVTSNYRLLKWFMPGISMQQPRWVLYLVIIDLTVLYLAYLSRKGNQSEEPDSNRRNPYAEDVFYISIAMLLFIPTFFVTNASARFIWQILLLIFICYAKDDELRIPVNSFGSIRLRRRLIVMLAFLLFFSYYANLPYRGTANDTKSTFTNNLIYGGYNPKH